MALKSRPQNKRVKVAVASTLLLVAFGLLADGALGFWQRWQATNEPNPVVSSKVITNSTDKPSETKPHKACAEYKVEPQYPQKIDIPSLGVSGCIERVGIDQHGAIAVPNNIYTAAWYVKSALPGQPGLSVIDGHISGIYNTDGIFQHLDRLRSGDIFTVTLGSGKRLSYEVFNNHSIPVGEAVTTLLRKDSGVKSQLNLITCGGQYDKTSDSYDHRVIISAKLL